MDNKNKIWEELLKLSDKSAKKGDIPVGAILVKNSKIISKGYNTRQKQTNVLGHAEVNCILKANKRLKNWNLSGCTLYVTLKPCSMCETIIKQSRIDNVYYLLDKNVEKKEYDKSIFKICKDEPYCDEYKKKLSNFFKQLR